MRLVALGFACLVLLAACGGGASAEERWASGVCGQLAQYREAMAAQSLRISHVRPPLNAAGSAIYVEFNRIKDRTARLVAGLREQSLPDSESQAAAKKLRGAAIEMVWRYVPINERALERRLARLPENPTATEVFRILDGLQLFAVSQASYAAAVPSLAPFAGSKELQQAFADSRACDELTQDNQ